MLDIVKTPSTVSEWYKVGRDALPELWPQYRHLVLRALGSGDGGYAESDMLTMLLTEHWHLIAADRDGHPAAVGILNIMETPRHRILYLRYAAGELDVIEAGTAYLEDRARAHGCHAIEICGRPGWERLRKKDGYQKMRVVLRKELV